MHIGFHVTKDGRSWKTAINESINHWRTVLRANTDADTNGAGICVQVFVIGPRNTKSSFSGDDKADVREIVRSHNGRVRIIVHGAYIDIPWSPNPASGLCKFLPVSNVINELIIARDINADGVIVHMGKGILNDALLQDFLQRVYHGVISYPHATGTTGTIGTTGSSGTPLTVPILFLETNSAKASAEGTFETPAKLIALFNKVALLKPADMRVGLCIDTAHLFACGTSLSTAESTDQFFRDLGNAFEGCGDVVDAIDANSTHTSDARVPMMIHLNDQTHELGSGKDKHAALMHGQIWGAWRSTSASTSVHTSGLAWIIDWARRHHISVICERDSQHLIDLDLKLIASI